MRKRKPATAAESRIEFAIPSRPRQLQRVMVTTDVALMLKKIASAEGRSLSSMLEEALVTWVAVKRSEWTVLRRSGE